MGYIWRRLLRLAKVWIADSLPFSDTQWTDKEEEELRRIIEELEQKQASTAPPDPPLPPKVRWAYRTLGLRYPATIAEIKRTYRNKIKQYHPDRLRNLSPEQQQYAQQKAREINIAYTILREQLNF